MPRKPLVMVVDRDAGTRAALTSLLAAAGYDPVATDAKEALHRYLSERPAAVILDVGISGAIDGLRVLRGLKAIDRQVPVIILSAEGLTPSAIDAMALGAVFLVRKPVQPQELVDRLAQAFEERSCSREAASFDERLPSDPRYPMVFGQTGQMADIAELIERAGNTGDAVLIQGERGTGKELVARAIAAASRRGKTPFIKVHCAAIPAEFLEAQLFGYDDGAVTNANATHRKPGAFDSALHGTLFLDEIGGITPSLQVRLLHVLDDATFRRFAGAGENPGSTRVIAATTRDLDRAIVDGQFSRELFFRLSVIFISLPALRDRRDDIPPLIEYFLKKHAAQHRQPFHELDQELVGRLIKHDWPGNLRELEHVVKRAVVLGPDFSVEKELAHRPARPSSRSSRWISTKESRVAKAVAADIAKAHNAPPEPAVKGTAALRYSLKTISREAARRAERDLILRVLERTHWNRKAAARLLQISYKALLYKIKENALDDETW